MNVLSNSQFGGDSHPRNRSELLIQPLIPNIWFQIRTPATNGTTYGMKNSERISEAPTRYFEFRPRATTNGTMIETGRYRNANRNVTDSESQTRWSPAIRAKLSKPMNWSGSSCASVTLRNVMTSDAAMGIAVKARN